jgi:hypothetical protein
MLTARALLAALCVVHTARFVTADEYDLQYVYDYTPKETFPAPSPNGAQPAPSNEDVPAPSFTSCKGNCGKVGTVCSCTIDCLDYGDCCGTSAADPDGFFANGCDKTTTTTTTTTTTSTTTTTEQNCVSNDCLGGHCDFMMLLDSDLSCKSLEEDFQCNCEGCYCGGFGGIDTTTTTGDVAPTTTTGTTWGTTTTRDPNDPTTTLYIDEELYAICRAWFCLRIPARSSRCLRCVIH